MFGPLDDEALDELVHRALARKQERATALALPMTRNTALPANLFFWLGITQYLTIDAVQTILSMVASCAPGLEVVFSYVVTPPFLNDLGRMFAETISAVAADSDELHGRSFEGRPDGHTPYTVLRFIAAAVPG